MLAVRLNDPRLVLSRIAPDPYPHHPPATCALRIEAMRHAVKAAINAVS
jgi:hypothetical protein